MSHVKDYTSYGEKRAPAPSNQQSGPDLGFTPSQLDILEQASFAATKLAEQASLVLGCINGLIDQAEAVEIQSRRERLEREGNELIAELNRDIQSLTAVDDELIKAVGVIAMLPNSQDHIALLSLRFDVIQFKDEASIDKARSNLSLRSSALSKLLDPIKRCSRMFRHGADVVRIAIQNRAAAESDPDDLNRFVEYHSNVAE